MVKLEFKRKVMRENDDEDKPIAKKIVLPGKREEKVEKLIMKANNRGGTDNISIAYLLKEGE